VTNKDDWEWVWLSRWGEVAFVGSDLYWPMLCSRIKDEGQNSGVAMMWVQLNLKGRLCYPVDSAHGKLSLKIV